MRAEAGESTSQAKTYKAQQERQVLDLGKHEGQSSGQNLSSPNLVRKLATAKRKRFQGCNASLSAFRRGGDQLEPQTKPRFAWPQGLWPLRHKVRVRGFIWTVGVREMQGIGGKEFDRH